LKLTRLPHLKDNLTGLAVLPSTARDDDFAFFGERIGQSPVDLVKPREAGMEFKAVKLSPPPPLSAMLLGLL
jgi:hypothetical protein